MWEDEAEASARPLLTVSEGTAKALKTAFGRPLSNQARLQTRKPYAFPNVEATRCPKLDPVAKQLLHKEQKQADASLAKLQTLVLDAVAPLVHMVNKGTLSLEQAAEAANTAITLLGNASAHITKERRRKAITGLNRKVHPLAEEEDIFEEAAPLLLGQVFEAKMKAHLESLKCLAANSQRDRDGPQSFRRGHSHYPPRGGGQYRRGGNGNNHQRRFQPYAKGKENQFKRQNQGKSQ